MKTDLSPHEIESTLLVCAHEPEVVCEQIANLNELAGYRLLRGAAENIHDIYFDTPDRALHKQQFALRVRRVNTQTLLTLKGDAQTTDWGAVKRLEHEVPWSKDGLGQMIAKLERLGIRLPSSFSFSVQVVPTALMQALGLEIIQERETYRQIRNVLQPQAKLVLVELAVDTLTYHFDAQRVRCYEIELEEKSAGHSELLQTLTENLMLKYGTSLRRWPHGKLATGIALEHLLAQASQSLWLNKDVQLKPELCDLVEERLSRSESK